MNFPYLRYLRCEHQQQVEIFRPVVPVTLAGPAGELDFYALVDAGSDDTLIPLFVAEELGLVVDNSATASVRGIGDEQFAISSARVKFHLTDGHEAATWESEVGVVHEEDDEHGFIILGHSGCLEYFTAEFDSEGQKLKLAPNFAFEGVVDIA